MTIKISKQDYKILLLILSDLEGYIGPIKNLKSRLEKGEVDVTVINHEAETLYHNIHGALHFYEKICQRFENNTNDLNFLREYRDKIEAIHELEDKIGVAILEQDLGKI